MSDLDRIEGFRQGADLVDLNEDGIGDTFGDAVAQADRVGDKQIVADQLHPIADQLG